LKYFNFQNQRWRTAAILKTVKSPYILNRLTEFDEIWHADADCPPTGDISLKFRIFQNQDGGGRNLENHKNRDSLRNLASLCKMGLLTVLTVKNWNFQNSRWRTAAILKTNVKSSYISNRWIDFDEIWHGDANFPATGDRPLKFYMFQKRR